MLVVTLIGWKVAGLPGALAATLGMCLPMSVLIYLLVNRWEQYAGRRWQQAISLGVAPLAVGLVFSGAALIAQAAKFQPGAWGVALVTAGVTLRYRTLHPLWLIAAGALLGLSGVL